MASYAWRDIVLELEEAVTSSAGVHDPRVVEGCAACQPLQKSLVRLFRTRERVVQDFRLDIREQLGREGWLHHKRTDGGVRPQRRREREGQRSPHSRRTLGERLLLAVAAPVRPAGTHGRKKNVGDVVRTRSPSGDVVRARLGRKMNLAWRRWSSEVHFAKEKESKRVTWECRFARPTAVWVPVSPGHPVV